MRWFRCLLCALILMPSAGAAQEAGGTGAFLFSYRPDDGARAAFEAGYGRHLEWHREAGDTLTWIGFDVIAGPGLGRFVDGIFGVSFAAVDGRVDPAGDARDAASNVDPHATPVSRELLRLRPDLGTAAPLEAAEPTALVQVVRYTGPPAGLAILEDALRRLRSDGRVGELHPFTVYETLAGSTSASFVVMVWRRSWSSFDQAGADPVGALRRALMILEDGAAAGVRLASNEVWRYRADLTYRADGPGDDEH